MQLLRTLLVVVLALSWAPLTSHCKLAALFDSDAFRCHAEMYPSPSGSDPCDSDGCCQAEAANYHLPKQQELSSVVFLDFLIEPEIGIVDKPFSKEVCRGIPTAAPPELSRSWQFSLRTALPIRAPSLAS